MIFVADNFSPPLFTGLVPLYPAANHCIWRHHTLIKHQKGEKRIIKSTSTQKTSKKSPDIWQQFWSNSNWWSEGSFWPPCACSRWLITHFIWHGDDRDIIDSLHHRHFSAGSFQSLFTRLPISAVIAGCNIRFLIFNQTETISFVNISKIFQVLHCKN